MNTEVYIKIDQNTEINKKTVMMSDIAKIHCSDSKIRDKLNDIPVLNITSKEAGVYTMTFIKIAELIHGIDSRLTVVNAGENEFIITYKPKEPGNSSGSSGKIFEYVKVAFVCLVSFLGAAFTIMTFNLDASVSELFDKVYLWFMNVDKQGAPTILELSYCIGLPIGILVFFNHFSKKKLTIDPTPIHIEMRNYEKQINEALIQDASREGKTIDVS